MVRKNKLRKSKINWFLVVPVGLIILVLLGGTVFFVQQSVVSGLTVESISRPTFKSNVEDLSGLKWLVTASLGGGESIFGVSKSRLNGEMPDGLEVEYGFEVEARNVETWLEYSIKRDIYAPVYEYSYHREDDVGVFKINPDPCPSGYTWSLYEGNIGNNDVRHCIKQILVGWKADINKPDEHFSADLSINYDNPSFSDSQTVTLSKTNPSVNLGSNSRVQLLGLPRSGNAFPNIENEYYAFLSVTGSTGLDNWHFIKQTRYDDYNDGNNFFKNSVLDRDDVSNWNNVESSDTDIQSIIEEQIRLYNNNKDRLNVVDSIGNTQELDAKIDIINFRYDPSNVLFIPRVRFIIDAETIGIRQLVGQPKILGASCPTFGSDGIGSIRLDVKNVGSADGFFVVSKTGCTSFSQSKSEQFNLAEGKTINDYIVELSVGTRNTEISESCKVEVFDKNFPSNKDSVSVNCKLTPTKVCTPNQLIPDSSSNCIKKCDAQGENVVVVECCESGESIVDIGNDYQCVGANDEVCNNNKDDDGDGKVDEGCDDNGDVGKINYVLVLIGFIGGGLSVYFTRPIINLLSGSKRLKNKKWFKPLAYLIIFVIGMILSVWLWKEIIGFFKGLFTFNFLG